MAPGGARFLLTRLAAAFAWGAFAMIGRDDVRFARLSPEDLEEIALGLRMRSIGGDTTAGAVAEALESVIRRRRLAHERKMAARFVSSTWQRMAFWATTRQ